MFHGKFVIVVEVHLVAETQIVIMDVNVNVTIRSKIIKKHVFKDREPKKGSFNKRRAIEEVNGRDNSTN
jgi:hypothetical protein